MPDDTTDDWPGRADGFRARRLPAELDEISGQQSLISDESASASTATDTPPPKPANGQ